MRFAIIFAAFIFFLGFFIAFNPGLTGFATLRSFEINLDKNYYYNNESLSGVINISFADYPDFDTPIKVELDNLMHELGLINVLNLLNMSYELSNETISIEDKGSIKIIYLNEAGYKLIALKLPIGSEIVSIDLNVSGSIANPYIDINNDNTKELSYEGRMDFQLDFNNYKDNFVNSLQQFLNTCQPDSENNCVITIAVGGTSSGYIELRDLLLMYRKQNEIIPYNSLYNIRVTPKKVTNLNNRSISSTELGVPINIFSKINLTNLESRQHNLKATIESTIRIKPFVILPTLQPTQLPQLNQTIGLVTTNIANLNNLSSFSDIAHLLSVSLDTSQLSNLQLQLINIYNSNLSNEEKQNLSSNLINNALSYADTLPKKIIINKKFKDTIFAEPNDIRNFASENIDLISDYQENAQITIEVNSYTIEYNFGDAKKTTIITKKITANNLSELYVYEIIPKDIANNVDLIRFENTNYDVVISDPIVRFYLPTLNSFEIKYAIDSEIDLNKVYSIKTVLMPLSLAPEIEVTYICGDGVCTKPVEDSINCPADCPVKKFPWWIVLLGIIVLVVGIIYINYYRGRADFRRLTTWKMPFKSIDQLKDLREYVSKSLSLKIKKKHIAKKLYEGGWAKKQIMFVFDDVNWERRRVLIETKVPVRTDRLREVQKYIEKCMKVRMDKERVTKDLLSGGWKQDQVDEAFKRLNRKYSSWFPYLRI